MKRKDAARKEGTCPRDAPKDEKCASCRSKKGACLVAARIAAGNALPSPDEPDVGAVQHFCNLLIKHVKEHVNANLTTMYAQSDGCKAQFKKTTHYLWISEQYEKTKSAIVRPPRVKKNHKLEVDPL